MNRVSYLALAILLVAWAATACGAGSQAPTALSSGETKIPPTFPTTDVLGCVSKSVGSETEPVVVHTGPKFWQVFWNADTGCIAVQETAGAGNWTSYSVKKNALNGGRISNVSVNMLSDAKHGWILATASPNAGQAPRALFRTVNGGKTWSQMKVDPSSFPMGNAKVNWSFTSPLDGWMVTADPSYSPTRLYVYRSTDGGVAWTDHWIALPQGLHKFAALIPAMTSGGNIVTLTLRALSNNNRQYVVLTYATADAGVTWKLESRKIYARVGITPNRPVPVGMMTTPTRPAPTISLPLIVGSKRIPWKKNEFAGGYTNSSCTRVGYQAFEVPVPPAQAMEVLTKAFVAPDYTKQSSATYGPNNSVEPDVTYTSASSNIVVTLSFKKNGNGSHVGYWVSDILTAKSGYTCRSVKP
ncbi:MAG: hypothetical protein M0Z66_01710 [Thermaerobacter sp.]|nr:hypothetical protein [Thermaerobacter sp.]